MNRFFVFRVDADSIIGIGHLMRCLTLSKKLSGFGFSTAFICNKSTQIYKEFITKSGSLYFEIQDEVIKNYEYDDAQKTLNICEKIDVYALIIDHYNLGINWEKEVRKKIKNIIVIDDLANRNHDCLFLLDSTFDRKNVDYLDKVGGDTNILTGSKFCILREEFYLLRAEAINKRLMTKEIGSILLNFGGVDPFMHTILAYRLIREINTRITIIIIISKACTSLDKILKISNTDVFVDLHIDTDDVANIMLNADLSIGALGTTSWERCCLGLPSIALLSADNQKHNANLLDKNNAIILSNENILKEDLVRIISNHDSIEIWKNMVTACFKICDGKGLYRVSHEFLKSSFSLNEFSREDSQDLFSWQVEDTSRLFSRNTNKPSRSEHDNWVEKSLSNNNRRIWVLKVDGFSAGYVRLDDIEGAEEVSILISEKFRNIGLASFAIDEAKTKSKNNNILAYVDSENTASINLFVRSGFNKIKENNYLWKK